MVISYGTLCFVSPDFVLPTVFIHILRDHILSYSLPLAAVQRYEGHGSQKDKQEQLKQAHAAQVRALQDEHRRQQEELLQVRQWGESSGIIG